MNGVRRASAAATSRSIALSLRLEKNFPTWYRELRPIYGPYEADVGRFVDLGKEDFIGKRAAMAEQQQGGTLRRLTMVVDADLHTPSLEIRNAVDASWKVDPRRRVLWAEPIVARGRAALEAGEYRLAIADFHRAAGHPVADITGAALLGTGDSLAALDRNPEALAAYAKLVNSVPVDARRRSPDYATKREAAGEAAYRSGALLRSGGRHREALNMFILSSFFTTGTPAYGRALIGAMHCFVALGDRAGAEAYYRQLQARGADESVLAEARRALDTVAIESALPRRAR